MPPSTSNFESPSVAPVRAETLVELLAVLAQVPGEGLEQRRPLVERELPQRGPAGLPAVGADRGEIEAVRRQAADLLAGHGVGHRPPVAGPGLPTALQVAGNHHGEVS